MVAIFTGAGTGFERGSGTVLGSSGLLGSASQGRGGEGAFVNAANGNLLLSRQDEFLVGRGPDVAIGRAYNSQATAGDDNNDKWRQSTDRRVTTISGTTVRRVSADGSETIYTWDAGRSAYVSKEGDGAYDTIVKSGNQWIWTDGSTQRVEKYDDLNGGRIVWEGDTDLNAITYTYVGDKLDKATTADGAWVQYSWSGYNITRVITGYTDLATGTAKTLSRVWYEYTGSQLTKVRTDLTPDDNTQPTDAQSYWTSYGYDGAGRVNSITQKDGSSLTVTYDASGRVETLTQLAASGVNRVTTLAYYAGYTTVTDPTGQVTRLDYDASGNLTKITAPPASTGAAQQAVQFSYNANGDLATTTDALGNLASYTYDGNGNVLTATDRLGNVVTRSYGTKNELLTETHIAADASGAAVSITTRYVYDAENHLRYVVSGEGNVVEYRYTATGEVQYRIEYPEHGYSIGSGALSEATMDAWRNGLADRSSTKITYNQYDARGGLSWSRDFGIASTGGAESTAEGAGRTYYTYDQAGRLLSRSQEGQNAETMVYDGMGRMTAATDVNGGTTTFVFDDTASTTTVTLASGYVTVSTYNKAGDLINQTDSGSYVQGGTSANQYDKLGRLRIATNAAGVTRYNAYDKAGRLIAEVNHYGDMTEYRYDANNRVVSTTRYATRLSSGQLAILQNPDSVFDVSAIRPTASGADLWSWSVYDKQGQVVAAIAGDGSVATMAYDQAGHLVTSTEYAVKLTAGQIAGFKTTPPVIGDIPAPTATAAVTRAFFDRDGRALGALDGEGFLTRKVYDKAGQLVAEIASFNATTAGLRATGSFNDLVASVGTSANDRATRYVYDGQGLLRYVVDGLNQVTAYGYDTAGLQTSQTVYAAAMAATADYTYDNVKALTGSLAGNSANRTSWAVYDATGRLAFAIDADGGVTGFTYDNRGQVTRSVQYAAKYVTSSLPALATMNSWSGNNAGGGAADRVTRMWYTARGETRYVVDAEGYVARTDYNAAGKVTAKVVWANKISVSNATTIGQVDSLSNASGDYATHSYAYHPDGMLYIEYDAYGIMTVYDYSPLGKLAGRYDAYGTSDQSITAYGYDGAGRVVSETHAYGTAEASTTYYGYDGLGNRTQVTDPNGNLTSFTFDKTGQMKTRTDALSGVISYEYNAFGEVWKVTDARGNSSYSWYDKLGRVTQVRDAGNYLTETNYTRFGEVSSLTRRFNQVAGAASMATPPSVAANGTEDATTYFYYDKLGRVTQTNDAMGFYETYSYDAFGNRLSVTAKSSTDSPVAGAVTTYSYDRLGHLLTETLPMATYDGAGNLTSSTVVNRYEYDSRGNRTKKVEADNLGYRRTTTYTFDKNNRLIETRGDAVNVIADDLVSVSTVTPVQTIRYDARGNVKETIDAAGARTLIYYDALNRKKVEIRQTSASDNTYSSYTYDANSNLKTSRVYAGSISLPGSVGTTPPAAPATAYRETSFNYDALNRMSSSQVSNVIVGTYASGYAAANLVTSYVYDANGNLLKVTDPNGADSFSWYDAMGRKTAQLDAEGYLTSWAYDPDGNVTEERRYATRYTGGVSYSAAPGVGTSGTDRVTQYGYDRKGNRTSESRLSVEAYTVNSGNGVLSGASGTATVQFLYNGLGQVVRKIQGTGDQILYAYDGSGRLSSETRASFVDFNGQWVTPTTQYQYDGFGNLARTIQNGATNAATRVTSYTYGAGGRMATMTDAAGFTRTYAYDVMGRVKKETFTRATAAGGGVTDAISTRYDLAGRIVFQGIATWNGSSFVTVDYSQNQFNAFGEVWKNGINGLWQTENQYDNAGRLIATNAGDGVWKFMGYDRNGNQTVAISSAGTNLAGQSFATVLSWVGAATVNATYTVYDKRNLAVQIVEEGRQLNASTSDQTVTTRAYNAFGEVASETNALGGTLDYTYNALGKLIKSESPAVWITLANGAQQYVRPTELYYYDISGRLVGNRDANSNLSTRSLIAGTGYGSANGLVAASFAADGGKVTNAYDIHGDVRRVTDQIGRVTTQDYDAMGRVTTISHYGGLVESYAYDGLGQRIQAWNNQYQNPIYGPEESYWVEDPYDPYGGYYGGGHWEYYTPIIGYTPEKALTEYDSLGRVVSQLAFGGDLTTVSYSWNGGISTSGIGTLGGWTQVTTYANGRTLVENEDIYNRTTAKTDLGGHAWTFTYDVAGRLTQTGTGGVYTTYNYLNTGLVGSVILGEPNPQANTTWSRTVSVYGYDKLGQRLTEQTSEESGVYTPGYWYEEYDPYYGYPTYSYWVDETYYTTSATLQNSTVTYDALGRLKTFSEAGTTYTPAANIAYEYDANGNVRRTTATYRTLDYQGNVSSYPTTTDYWFRYDSMNRVVTDKGTLRNGQIVRGEAVYGTGGGQDILYDLAGQRVAVMRTEYSPGYYDYEWGYYYPGSYYESRENYIYDSAGRVFEIQTSIGGYVTEDYDYNTGLATPPGTIPSAPSTGTVRSRFYYDLTGHQTQQNDYEANGSTIAYSRYANYNNKGQITYESTSTKKWDGHTYQSYTFYDYGYGSNYALGSTISISTINYRDNNNANAPDTLSTNSYVWWDGAVQSQISFKPNTSQSTTYYTTFYYNGLGQLTSLYIGDARARNVSFKLSGDGQIIRRDEQDYNWSNGDPHEIWYRFNSRQLGYVGNNGTSDVSTEASIGERQTPGPSGTPGAFRNGATYGSSYAEFANSYDPINSYSQGSGGGSYTVRTGDTLQSIALATYGDANLWYRLADANGLSGASALIEGRTLTLPSGVVKSTYNASGFKPYNAAEAIGDVTPSTPQPQAASKKKGCGVFGAILLAVVAIAVTVVTSGAALAALSGSVGSVASGISTILGTAVFGGTVATGVGAGALIAAGAIGGMVGSIASQGVGVATGIQEKFSWKAVALAGIGGAVSAGIGPGGLFGKAGMFGNVGNSAAVQAGLTSAAGSAITQGIGVALGLQSKFDFVGVAVAGVGAAVGRAVGDAAGSEKGLFGIQAATGSVGNVALSSTASALAGAATRSAITGTSFLDNFVASIPDIVGQVLQRAVTNAIATPEPEDPSTEVELTAGEQAKAALTDVQIAELSVDYDLVTTDGGLMAIKRDRPAGSARTGGTGGADAGPELHVGTDGIIVPNADGYAWLDTAPASWQAGMQDTGGINFYFDAGAGGFKSDWYGFTGGGAVRLLTNASGQTYVYNGGTLSIPGLGVTISSGQAAPPVVIRPSNNDSAPQPERQDSGPSLAREGISFLLDVLPVIGTVKSGLQVITGRDLITGEPVNRWVEGAGFLASFIPGGRAVSKAGDAVRFGERVFEHSDDIVRFTSRLDDVGELRRVGGFGGCFVAGTLVHTEQGLVPIEQISIGTMVLSQSEHQGPVGYRRVNDVFSFEDKAIWEVAYTTAQGRTESQRATPNHPYWVETIGWTGVEFLEPGQVLQLADGSSATVVSAKDTGETGPVHNFEVDGFHTYYVGETGVWVHNTDCFAKLPELEISRTRMPDIANNIEAAIKDGKPSVLTRTTERDAIRGNRSGALRGQTKPGRGQSLDEYPFASTTQGGAGSRVTGVPVRQQNIQGGVLSSFYRNNNIGHGQSFRVKVVP